MDVCVHVCIYVLYVLGYVGRQRGKTSNVERMPRKQIHAHIYLYMMNTHSKRRGKIYARIANAMQILREKKKIN